MTYTANIEELTHETKVINEFDKATTSGALDSPLEILLVEDLVGDSILTKYALDFAKIPYALTTLRKGNSVVPYLISRRQSRPDLIILDLGLPEMDGFEILAKLSERPFTEIEVSPIVILTSLDKFEYICKCYPRLYIMNYLTKPCDYEKVREVLSRAFNERKSFARA